MNNFVLSTREMTVYDTTNIKEVGLVLLNSAFEENEFLSLIVIVPYRG